MQNDITSAELKMDPAALYREETYTDRAAGTIRKLVPVTAAGEADPAREPLFVGQAQLLTPMGAVPLSFEIDARTLAEAIDKFPAAAEASVNETVAEIQEMRRQAASSIVVPEGGAAGAGLGIPGAGGGGKIKLP